MDCCVRQRGASAVQPLVSGHVLIYTGVVSVWDLSLRTGYPVYTALQTHVVGHVLVLT